MVNQLVEQRLELAIPKLGRLAQLLLIGVSMMTYSILLMNTANSLFLSHIGAEKLPICFMLVGVVAVIVYSIISPLIDKVSRVQLFRYAVLISTVIAVGLRLALNLESPIVYFLISLNGFFQFDLYANILLPNLVKDYLTSLEYKRYAPFIGIAQASGILIGGTLTVFLSRVVNTENILICLFGFYSIMFGQLMYLENTQRRSDTVKSSSNATILDTLKMMPELVRRYPLSFYLASASFLFILAYIVSEFLWFSVYEQNFQEEALTGFLGWIRIGSSTIQIVVLFCFTRPLLQWLGVGRMNVVYPITTLSALAILSFNPTLGSAILLNFNGDSLGKAVHGPVHQLNYNAIPSEYSGRIRALSDGVIYGLGLTLAGLLLWTAHNFLSLEQITWIGLALASVALILKLPMGGFYAQGLEEMIRSNSLNLDDFNAQLPSQSKTVIREFLADNDRYTQIKGIELATSLRQPSQFIPDIEDLLLTPDIDVRRALLKLFSAADGDAIQYFQDIAFDKSLAADGKRALAVEVLVANQFDFDEQQLRTLLKDPDPEVATLAVVAATRTGDIANPQIRALCEEAWPSSLPEPIAQAVVRVVEVTGDQDLMPLIQSTLAYGTAEAKRLGLEALVTLARIGDQEVADIAVAELTHPEPEVRAVAFYLLGICRCKGMLRYVASGLGDPDPRVRQKAAMVLAAYGQQGLSLAQDSLASTNPDVVQTAIAAIGQVRTKQASNILYEYLAPDFQEVVRTSRWQTQIPQTDPSWQPLTVAIADYHQRLIQKVLYILSCLGHSRTVATVNRILNTDDPKEFANAVEVLASISHRRFVLPLMPVLEDLASPTRSGRLRSSRQWLRTKGYKLLLEALESSDRWIRIGSLIALAMVPAALMQDPDPTVKMVAKQIFLPIVQRPSSENTFMNRLLLLKNVPLFKNLSLDEIVLIDKTLEQQQALAGETIYTEGSWGTHFYIVAAGSVQIIKEIDGEPKELRQASMGQYFGEVALFDEAPHWDGAISSQDSILLKLEKNRFISLITQRPHILMEICRFLSQRLRETDKYRSLRTLPPPNTQEVMSEDITTESEVVSSEEVSVI